MPTTLEFFFDLVSPYSYLASTQVERVAERSGARLVWRPFLLAGVFQATGNVPPLGVPAKAAWLLKDLQDWGRHYGLPPLALPGSFPFRSQEANRLALVSLQEGRGPAFIHAAFRTVFVEGQALEGGELLGRLAEQAGLERGEALARMASTEVKLALRRNTEEAVARGAFAAPTFFVGEDMYVGNDRLSFVEAALARREAA